METIQIEPGPDAERLRILNNLGILDTPPDPTFDGIVQLASLLCDVPTALVSLVDVDRQWFKARVGFPQCETALDRSVCRLVVQGQVLVVIPDLTADERTCGNPLVTDDPAIRFYAGAPLVTQSGHVLGALCVIDQVPRPAGLTDTQTAGLLSLARQATELIELRDVARSHADALVAYETAKASQAASDRRWQAIFETLQEGFILGRVMRDEKGVIRDWRYEAVNPAWANLIGIPVSNAIGRSIRDLLPGIEEEWVMEFASVVDTGETARFTRQVGMLGRWYDGLCQSIGNDEFTVIFVEVTERIHAITRRDALLQLGDALRDCYDEHAMRQATTRIVGEALDASRTAYGELSEDSRLMTIASDWSPTEPGVLVGVHEVDSYGHIRETFLEGMNLVIDDVALDPRTADDVAAWRALDIASVLNLPVRERDRTVAMFIVQYAAPHQWTADQLAFVRMAAERLEVGIARLRSDEQQAVLNAEIAHRLKNSLAMVQAIALQTLKPHTSPEVLNSFNERLQALGAAHDVLLSRDVKTANLNELLARILAMAGVGERYELVGEPMQLGARATLSASLLFHELACNAMKFGALSVDHGHVAIDWRVEGEGDAAELVLDWRELDGRPATPPTRPGFGSKLLRLGLVGTGRSDLRYLSTGFEATFRASKKQIEDG